MNLPKCSGAQDFPYPLPKAVISASLSPTIELNPTIELTIPFTWSAQVATLSSVALQYLSLQLPPTK